MKVLEERIKKDGQIKSRDVLRVDSFLNHQVDVALLEELAQAFRQLFADVPITKVLTIESSGIALAVMTALQFKVPVVFAKKSQTSNLDDDLYHTSVYSFTHQKEMDVIVSKSYLEKQDQVLIIDDFLANGCAVRGLIDIVKQAGASVGGIGVAIEKGFQGGGDQLRQEGYRLISLAVIDEMDCQTNQLVFRK